MKNIIKIFILLFFINPCFSDSSISNRKINNQFSEIHPWQGYDGIKVKYYLDAEQVYKIETNNKGIKIKPSENLEKTAQAFLSEYSDIFKINSDLSNIKYIQKSISDFDNKRITSLRYVKKFGEYSLESSHIELRLSGDDEIIYLENTINPFINEADLEVKIDILEAERIAIEHVFDREGFYAGYYDMLYLREYTPELRIFENKPQLVWEVYVIKGGENTQRQIILSAHDGRVIEDNKLLLKRICFAVRKSIKDMNDLKELIPESSDLEAYQKITSILNQEQIEKYNKVSKNCGLLAYTFKYFKSANYLNLPNYINGKYQKGKRDYELAKLLIDNKVDVNQTCEDGLTPLHYAASLNNVMLVSLLLDNGANINAKNLSGETPLDRARRFKIKETVSFLEEKIKNPNFKSQIEFIPQYSSSLYKTLNKGKLKLAYKLLETSTDLNQLNPSGETALHLSISKGYNEFTKALLDKGAAINISDAQEKSPLFYQILKNDLTMIEYLLIKGANPNSEDILKFDFNSLPDIKILALLCKYGFNINNAIDSRSILQKAIYKYNFALIRELIRLGARIDFTGFNQESTLTEATKLNSVEIVKILLENGANIDFKNSDGQTALMIAREKGYKDIENILIRFGK